MDEQENKTSSSKKFWKDEFSSLLKVPCPREKTFPETSVILYIGNIHFQSGESEESQLAERSFFLSYSSFLCQFSSLGDLNIFPKSNIYTSYLRK